MTLNSKYTNFMTVGFRYEHFVFKKQSLWFSFIPPGQPCPLRCIPLPLPGPGWRQRTPRAGRLGGRGRSQPGRPREGPDGWIRQISGGMESLMHIIETWPTQIPTGILHPPYQWPTCSPDASQAPLLVCPRISHFDESDKVEEGCSVLRRNE